MLLILKNAERRYKKNGICYVIQLKKIVLGIFPGMKFIAVVSQKVCKKLLIFRRAGFVLPHNIIIRICNPEDLQY